MSQTGHELSYGMHHQPSSVRIQDEGMFNNSDFLICRSCFWCASVIAKKSMDIRQCPNCKSKLMESMPIGLDDDD
ncbi:MAG TPA: hypothetical protein VFZ67_01185 [Nitrososphaera sp.]